MDIRADFQALPQLLATQAQGATNHVIVQDNVGLGPQPNASTPASRIPDFTRINHPTFYCTKVDEDTQHFIDEVFKVVDSMGVNPSEKEELAAYQLRMWLKCGLNNGGIRDP